MLSQRRAARFVLETWVDVARPLVTLDIVGGCEMLRELSVGRVGRHLSL